jgi:hypothetical protein
MRYVPLVPAVRINWPRCASLVPEVRIEGITKSNDLLHRRLRFRYDPRSKKGTSPHPQGPGPNGLEADGWCCPFCFI